MHEKLSAIGRELCLSFDKIILRHNDCFYFEVEEARVETVAKVLKQIIEYPSVTPSDIVLQYKVAFEKGHNLQEMEEFTV